MQIHSTMKFFLTAILISVALIVNAQEYDRHTLKEHKKDIKYSLKKRIALISLDTLFYIGKPYCIVKVINKSMTQKDYRVFSLAGKEEIFITTDDISSGFYVSGIGSAFGYWNYGTAIATLSAGTTYDYYYTFYFIGTKQRAEISKSFGSKIPMLIAQYDFLNNDSLIRSNVQTFVNANGTPFSDKKKKKEANSSGSGVRDVLNDLGLSKNNNSSTVYNASTAPPAPVFQVLENKIYKDSKQVSYFEDKSGMLNGQPFRKLVFFMPDGAKVAEATSSGPDDHNWNLQTLQDNQIHPIQSQAGNDVKDITAFLLTYHYL